MLMRDTPGEYVITVELVQFEVIDNNIFNDDKTNQLVGGVLLRCL